MPRSSQIFQGPLPPTPVLCNSPQLRFQLSVPHVFNKKHSVPMVVPGTKFPRTGRSQRIAIWTAQLTPLRPQILSDHRWGRFPFQFSFALWPKLSGARCPHQPVRACATWDFEPRHPQATILQQNNRVKYKPATTYCTESPIYPVAGKGAARRHGGHASSWRHTRRPEMAAGLLRHWAAPGWRLLYSCWEGTRGGVAGAKIMPNSERFPGQQRQLGWGWKKQGRCKIWRARRLGGQSAPRLAAWPVSASNLVPAPQSFALLCASPAVSLPVPACPSIPVCPISALGASLSQSPGFLGPAAQDFEVALTAPLYSSSRIWRWDLRGSTSLKIPPTLFLTWYQN